MGKRKRSVPSDAQESAINGHASVLKVSSRTIETASKKTPLSDSDSTPRHIQIITGSYDRTLHGFIASVPLSALPSSLNNSLKSSSVTSPLHSSPVTTSPLHFQDTFLFHAHASAIRSLALSPLNLDTKPSNHARRKASSNNDETRTSLKHAHDKASVLLATGGTDERINLFQIAAAAPNDLDNLSSVKLKTDSTSQVREQPRGTSQTRNKELGSLLHHAASVNVLHFPSRQKLLSGADDNTIVVTRTRDWTALSTLKAPMPRIAGRPSGDTAPPGEAPCGIVALAVHPSAKLMITVGRGEKGMRLWNLVTGAKAAALTFDRELLRTVGEGRGAAGEGRRVVWNDAGDSFAVAFERGVVAFAMNCEPQCCFLPSPATKVHQIRFMSIQSQTASVGNSLTLSSTADQSVLAASTEDGRIIFYATDEESHASASTTSRYKTSSRALGELRTDASSRMRRLKDFVILKVPGHTDGDSASRIVVAAGSDGGVRFWSLRDAELLHALHSANRPAVSESSKANGTASTTHNTTNGTTTTAGDAISGDATIAAGAKHGVSPELGHFLGKYDTGSRITCLEAFVMLSPDSRATPQALAESAGEEAGAGLLDDETQDIESEEVDGPSQDDSSDASSDDNRLEETFEGFDDE